MWLFHRLLFAWQLRASHEIHLFNFWSLILHRSLTLIPTIKPICIQGKMIEEITIKFGTELKPTQYSWKSQLYNLPLWQRSEHLSHNLGLGNLFSKIKGWVDYVLQLDIELIKQLMLLHFYLLKASSKPLEFWILDSLSPFIGCLKNGPCFLSSFSWGYLLELLVGDRWYWLD